MSTLRYCSPHILFRHAILLSCLLLASGSCNAKTHASYLSPKYCTGLVEQFINSGMRSLDQYVNEDFDPKYTGGILNTVRYLDQRSDWLGECNDYLVDTGQGYIFYNDENTRKIFDAIDALAKELKLVRKGVEYPDQAGNNNPAPYIKSRFATLAELVDQHHTRMLMKKQFQ